MKISDIFWYRIYFDSFRSERVEYRQAGYLDNSKLRSWSSADVKAKPQWKVVVAHKESTWRQSQKPDERRLPVKGQSAPRVTSSVRVVWPFFDWHRPQISRWLRFSTGCDIFTTCVTLVVIIRRRLLCPGNRYYNGTAFVASSAGTCETTRYRDTSFLDQSRRRKFPGRIHTYIYTQLARRCTLKFNDRLPL